MQQLNVVQLAVKHSHRLVAQPEVLKVCMPSTRLQRLAYWLGQKVKLFEFYTPMLRVTETRSIRLESSARETIGKAVIDFMNADGRIDPKRDLVILWGSDKFAEFARDLRIDMRIDMRTDLEFCRNGGYRYGDIEVRLVHYISGPLVLRRADLA